MPAAAAAAACLPALPRAWVAGWGVGWGHLFSARFPGKWHCSPQAEQGRKVCGPDCAGTPGGRRKLGTGGVRHNKSLGAWAAEHARAPTGLTWQVCQLWGSWPAPCFPPSDGTAGSVPQGGQPPPRPEPPAKWFPAGQVRGRQLPAPSQACPQSCFLFSISRVSSSAC